MAAFKRTEIIQHPRFGVQSNKDNSWGPFGSPFIVQEYGAINHIDVSSQSPHLVAITSYSKVSLYDPVLKTVSKTLTKFNDAAFGAKFRDDGQLICAGTSEGAVKIFDLATKTQLRELTGHTTATHKCDFMADNKTVVSFSDDQTVRLWDLPSEALLETMTGHADYVRCGAVGNTGSNLVVSGSYDQTVRLWDRRTDYEAVLTLDHSSPVEDVLFLPGDSLIVSCGGDTIKVWDITSGGKLLTKIRPHRKTITCLCSADNGKSIVSGSLDRSAKRIDALSFKVTGYAKFTGALLSVGVDSNDNFVVGGTQNGLVEIYEKRSDTKDEDSLSKTQAKKRQSRHYLQYTHFTPMAGDVVVEPTGRRDEARHDELLRRYEYSKALDVTMKPYVQRRRPEYGHSVFYELMRRGALKTTLVGQEEITIVPILNYTLTYLTDIRFSEVLFHVAEIIAEAYCPLKGKSQKFEEMLDSLLKKLSNELRLIEELAELEGCIQMVMSAAYVRKREGTRIEQNLLRMKTLQL